MPKPTQASFTVAARQGVDPSSPEAVQKWFLEAVPNLPPYEIEKILEELLSSESTGETLSGPRCYPEAVPLPLLRESPSAPVPLFAIRLREVPGILLRRLLHRLGK